MHLPEKKSPISFGKRIQEFTSFPIFFLNHQKKNKSIVKHTKLKYLSGTVLTAPVRFSPRHGRNEPAAVDAKDGSGPMKNESETEFGRGASEN